MGLMASAMVPSTSLLQEDWTGSNGSAWNATRWSTQRDVINPGSPGTLDVQSNQGRVHGNAASERMVAFSALSVTDFDMVLRVRATTFAASLFPEVGFRIVSGVATGPPTGYAIQFSDSGSGTITLYKIAAYSTLGSAIVIGTGAFDKSIRINCVGTAIKVRQWNYSTTEPGTWDISVTDATYATGPIMLGSYLGSSTDVFFDELLVT
jgi:hypothetical protein